MTKPTVFISHISKETELAQILKRHLAKDFLNFFDIFVSSDGKSIKAGSKWLEKLGQALEETQIEIILCSKESVGRPWVNFEAGAGWIRGIQVIPVCHSELKPDELPVPLNMLQAVKANQPNSLQVLYEAIAETYGMNVPETDFEAIAREIREQEEKYKQAEQTLERIEHPRILCAASEEYSQIGFDLDVAVLERAFPQQVKVERNLTAKLLRDLLTAHRFDIVHLVLAVDHDNGALLFSPPDSATHKPVTTKVDKMSAEGFAALVVESQTRLVVLATCNALALAVEVAGVANMIATNREITGEAAAEWEDCFYDLLARGHSLYKAYELTKSNSGVPMRLIRLKDVAFAPELKRP
jgi:hypothetical protein